MKETLQKVGGSISAIALLVFAVILTVNDIKLNIVSWILWTCLDVLILKASLDANRKAGNNNWPWLPTGWAVGAACVTLTLLFRGNWQWTYVETLTVTVVTIATIIWKTSGPKAAVIALTIAMTVAGIPSVAVAWQTHDSSGWWMWASVVLSCIFTLAGTEKWTVEERFLPTASLIFNSLMTILVLI